MSTLFQAISEVTQQECGNKFLLPKVFHYSVKFLSHAYFVQLMFKDYSIVNKTEGVVLGTLSSYSLCLKVVLFAGLVENVLRQYQNVDESYRHLKSSIHKEYPIYQRISLKKYCVGLKPELSASLMFEMEIKIIRLTIQCKKIITCTVIFFKEIVHLSFALTEIYLICQGNNLAKIGAFTKIASNYSTHRIDLTNNNSFLIKEMTRMGPLIQKILIKAGVNKRVADLTKDMQDLFEKTEASFKKAAKEAQEFINPLYNKGKITPLDDQFEQGGPDAIQDGLELPPSRFPPWSGGKVEINHK